MLRKETDMKFHTVPDLAKMFHRSEAVIRAWLRSGFLPGTQVNRIWLVTPTQLQQFLDQIGAP